MGIKKTDKKVGVLKSGVVATFTERFISRRGAEAQRRGAQRFVVGTF